MMRDYLLFQLYAPLVSWGGQAVGQERPTDNHPSRSAMLGLLGAALGIERNDESGQQALRDSCHFAVKVYVPGVTLRDFHTIQTPPVNKKIKHLHTRRDELNAEKLGTTISFRSYQQEQLSVVALWLSEQPEYSLSDWQTALQAPHFHLYLGRKSCPLAAPLKASIVSAESLKAALDDYAIDTQLLDYINGQQQALYYWEQTNNLVSGMGESYTVPRYDQPLNRTRWQFVARDEYVSLAEGGE